MKTLKKIVVGVCGGIAVYKVVDVVSKLRQSGYEIQVVMSSAACAFVAPSTFAAVAGQRVITRMFPDTEHVQHDEIYPHIYPASIADLFLLAPATANMMAKIALGLADDVVCASAMAIGSDCLKMFCPAMNVNMWKKPSVQRNVHLMENDCWQRLGPARGALACGDLGEGRMVEPQLIFGEVIKQIPL